KIAVTKGYKVLVAREGIEGIELAVQFQPSGIFLDVQLPTMNGFVILDHLKSNLKTRHIPVHLISAEDQSRAALIKGAMGFSLKPVSRKDIDKTMQKLEKLHNSVEKELLIIEDDKSTLQAIENLLKNKQVNISSAMTGKKAISQLKSKIFDCIILDLKLPDTNGFELLEKLKSSNIINNIPIVVYTGKQLTKAELSELHNYTDSIVIKGASSPELLLDEVSLFLHSNETKLTTHQKRIMAELHNQGQLLIDKKI